MINHESIFLFFTMTLVLSSVLYSILERIEIKWDDKIRHNITGFESRHLMRKFINHKSKDNTVSKNLYYISFFSNNRGAESIGPFIKNGMYKSENINSSTFCPAIINEEDNQTSFACLNRIQKNQLILYYRDDIPKSINIYMVYQHYNWMNYLNNECGLNYECENCNNIDIPPSDDEDKYNNDQYIMNKKIYNQIIQEINYIY